MKTTINNNLRVYQVITSLGRQYFCNLSELNKVIKADGCKAGYFKIYHFWNNKAQKVSKKDLKSFFEGHHPEIKQKFEY